MVLIVLCFGVAPHARFPILVISTCLSINFFTISVFLNGYVYLIASFPDHCILLRSNIYILMRSFNESIELKHGS